MVSIREARPDDASLIVQFIKDLADYEREPHAAIVTEKDILRDGFSAEDRKFWVLIAEWNAEPVGFAFYFFNYSTWLGRPGLYLEDLFVRPSARGKGIGKALLARLAQIAIEKNCYGMRWQVLDWNQPAIDFYDSLGGHTMKEWLTVRLMGEPLKKLAQSSSHEL
jgi:GNAT superfamily N-acetyltransferase